MTDLLTSEDAVRDGLDAARGPIERIAMEVWDLSELSLAEVQSAKVHRRELEGAGFRTVIEHAAGVPTAFVAEWGQGGQDAPKVGFLAEYDALPDLANAPVPRVAPRPDGKRSGHGCGHNLLGAGLTGAALACKHALEASGTPGLLRVYGCAAEETEGAKVYMAREGLFDDLAACLHWHPAPLALVINARLAAANSIRIEFHGRSAHAGLEPWQGRSAVHGAEVAAHAINTMREHLAPTARTQYVYEAAGSAPNVVPDYARIVMLVRDADRARVQATTDWVRQIAAGAALATQTEARVEVFFGMHDLLPNRPLALRMQEHLERVGPPAWSAEEDAFARACQRELGLAEDGLASSVLPLAPEPALGGCSDVAEASWNAPTMGLAMPTMPLGVSLHTWAVTACAGMSIGLRGTLAAARVLAHTALDVLGDEELRAAAQDDFQKRTEGFTYISPLSDEQRHPRGLPPIGADGSGETVSALAGALAGRPTDG